jgi:hypothetical protein
MVCQIKKVPCIFHFLTPKPRKSRENKYGLPNQIKKEASSSSSSSYIFFHFLNKELKKLKENN